MKQIKSFTLGADPEIILKNKDEFISAEGLFGGTKANPKFISNEGHAIQEDNILVEFNIPPSHSKQEFIDNINYCKDYINSICELYGDIEMSEESFAEFNQKYLQTPQAKLFGCEPDFDVYAEDVNIPPKPSANTRSAGKMAASLYRNI